MTNQSTEELVSDRKKTHGSWVEQSALAHSLKATVRSVINNRHYTSFTPSQLEALDMICVKISRIVTGNPDEPDHWNDIAGYALLARWEGHEGENDDNNTG